MNNEIVYTCPVCAGPGVSLGVLGHLHHLSCRNCGIGFSVSLDDNADLSPLDPNVNRESMYFEIFARRDPEVGIKDVYEKVSFESGLVFESTEDLEETRQQLTGAFTEIYGGFVPVILFDFEPHDYYKGEDFAKDFIEKPAAVSVDLPFWSEEMIVLLETARIALSDEDIMTEIADKMDLSYDAMIDLHDKLIAYMDDDNADLKTADQNIWYAVLAVEKGPDGRELAINKPDTIDKAISLAREYNDRATHGYKCIIVRRQPDGVEVWSSNDIPEGDSDHA